MLLTHPLFRAGGGSAQKAIQSAHGDARTAGVSVGPAPELRRPCGGCSPAQSGGSAVGVWPGLGPTVH